LPPAATSSSPYSLDKIPALTRIILFLLSLYKRLLSPLLGQRCRFYPSCSDYARIAVARFGPWRGSILAAWRILRCQPMCSGGPDPVPETFTLPHCHPSHKDPESRG
jgi:putative membrane protein insertion efficiency factor